MPRKRKYNYIYIKEFLHSIGYTLLDKELKKGQKKISVKCPRGHVASVYFSNLHHHGHRCLECSGNRKYTLEEVQGIFNKEGYELVSTVYTRANDKLKTKCPAGHMYEVSLSKFISRGFRCSACSGKAGRNIEFAKRAFSERGYLLLSTEYVKSTEPLSFKCDKGHTHKMSLNNLLRGQGCGICFEEYRRGRSSKGESALMEFFNYSGISYIHRDRNLISPYELDFFFPAQMVAVEYCGLYWHSEDNGKARRYHYDKMIRCREKGVRLLTVFEDEFLERPGVVVSRIENALGCSGRRIYARKCNVFTISNCDAREFLNKYHLQGPGVCRVGFGIFYNGKLVGVMTGGVLSRRHVGGVKTLELKRLAFLPGMSIVGGASKLFKRLVAYARDEGYTEVRSYCDMRYGNYRAPVYEKLGFKLVSETKYTPHYFKGQKRYRNQSLRKTPEERKTGKTEAALRREQGFKIIWDCGHRTYSYFI